MGNGTRGVPKSTSGSRSRRRVTATRMTRMTRSDGRASLRRIAVLQRRRRGGDHALAAGRLCPAALRFDLAHLDQSAALQADQEAPFAGRAAVVDEAPHLA